jgi:hypothetical protein
LLHSMSAIPVLGPSQPSIQWVARALSPGVKWPGYEADHSPSISAKVNDTQTDASIEGRAVAQVVSRWLPTTAARVHIWAACGVCGRQSSTRTGFL